MADPNTALAGGPEGCGIPSTSPEDYHTAVRGQSDTTPVPVPSRAAPRLPCGRAAPGRRDATRAPASKIVGNSAGYVEEPRRLEGDDGGPAPGSGGELTTAVTTTQTTVRHQQHRFRPGRIADRSLKSRVACSWGTRGRSPRCPGRSWPNPARWGLLRVCPHRVDREPNSMASGSEPPPECTHRCCWQVDLHDHASQVRRNGIGPIAIRCSRQKGRAFRIVRPGMT
jgi:hypothetical protein